MTYEEAKDILRVAAAEAEWNCPLDYTEAFKKAEEALDKQITKTTEKRKPCPFCGGSPYIREITFSDTCCTADETTTEYVKKYRAICDNVLCLCHPQTRLFSTPEKAIEAWNRRIDHG